MAKRKAPLVKVINTDPNPLMMQDETRTLTARFAIEAFPREVSGPLEGAYIVCTLFRHEFRLLAGPELIFPCLVNGAMAHVHYELEHEGTRDGQTFRRYRKYDSTRREILSQGITLPGRAGY